MRTPVESVIYLYLFVCVVLLVFNIGYIARSGIVARRRARKQQKWRARLEAAHGALVLEPADVTELGRVDNLMALHAVLREQVIGTDTAEVFFRANAPQIQQIAVHYADRPVMERSFAAHVLATLAVPDVPNAAMLAEIVLGYLDDSTVYCRENVLHALYALGRSTALEHAFQILNDNEWYHSPKLVADGMVRFAGDRLELAQRLWRHRDDWEEPLVVGIVQYGSVIDAPELDEPFFEALAHERPKTEVRYALIRYFQHHPFEAVRPLLLHYLSTHEREDGQLAVPAASALASYPGEDTKAALRDAMRSPNWYVRRNAGMSLRRLGITDDDVRQIRASGDRYAADMLEYVLRKPLGGAPAPAVQASLPGPTEGSRP